MKSKAIKRAEAEKRHEAYKSLQSWERELLVAGRPGESRKELARIRAAQA